MTFLTTPCRPYVREMGYLKQIIAIRERYRRCPENWKPHLEYSRRAVLEAAGRCGRTRKVVILGSGMLLDLPLAELAAAFGSVVLVDVVHLREVREAVRIYPNVKLVEHDVSGVSDLIFREKPHPSANLPVPVADFPEVDSSCDLVVSLNILSQIPLIPQQFLVSKLEWPNDDALDRWGTGLMKAHYDTLKELPCGVCLIADREIVRRDRNGRVIDRYPSAGAVPMPDPKDAWIWELAPVGEVSKEFSVQLHTVALFDENMRY